MTILSFYGCGNIGDEALFTCILDQLRNEMPEADIKSLALSPRGCKVTDFSRKQADQDETQKIHTLFYTPNNVKRDSFGVLRKEWLLILRTLTKSDCIVYGGGHWLHDYSRAYLFAILGLAFVAKLLRKKVIMYAIGVGPITTSFGKFLTRVILDRLDLITVRDAYSLDTLLQAGVKKEIKVTADPSLLLKPASRGIVEAILARENIARDRCQAVFGLNISAWFQLKNLWRFEQMDFSKQYALIAQISDELIRDHQALIVIIPSMLPEDRTACENIIARMTHRESARIIQNTYSPAELMGIIGTLDLHIGMRLHPLIFATLTGVPTIGILYDQKVTSFMSTIGRGDWCLKLDDLERIPQYVNKIRKIPREEILSPAIDLLHAKAASTASLLKNLLTARS